MTGKQQPGKAFWTTVVVVVLVVLVAYPLSWGPFVGAATRGYVPLWVVNSFPYQPLFIVSRRIPGGEAALNRYGEWWRPARDPTLTRPIYDRTR